MHTYFLSHIHTHSYTHTHIQGETFSESASLSPAQYTSGKTAVAVLTCPSFFLGPAPISIVPGPSSFLQPCCLHLSLTAWLSQPLTLTHVCVRQTRGCCRSEWVIVGVKRRSPWLTPHRYRWHLRLFPASSSSGDSLVQWTWLWET